MYFKIFNILALTFLYFSISGAINITSKVTDLYKKHNCYRKAHGGLDLKTNTTLQTQAQEYADQLAKKNAGLVHSRGNYGENLAMTFHESMVNQVVKLWYDEIKKYDFSSNQFNFNALHFTQVVWKNSEFIGCGIAKGTKYFYIVCRYYLPGNIMGQFDKNVSPLQGDATSC